MQAEAHCLADPAFEAVADHGAAQSARNAKTDPGSFRIGPPQAESRKKRARILDPLVVNCSKIPGSQNADTFRKASDINSRN